MKYVLKNKDTDQSKVGYYKYQATLLMKSLKDGMAFSQIDQNEVARQLPDGTVIRCSSVYGYDTAVIDAPSIIKEEEKPIYSERRRSMYWVEMPPEEFDYPDTEEYDISVEDNDGDVLFSIKDGEQDEDNPNIWKKDGFVLTKTGEKTAVLTVEETELNVMLLRLWLSRTAPFSSMYVYYKIEDLANDIYKPYLDIGGSCCIIAMDNDTELRADVNINMSSVTQGETPDYGLTDNSTSTGWVYPAGGLTGVVTWGTTERISHYDENDVYLSDVSEDEAEMEADVQRVDIGSPWVFCSPWRGDLLSWSGSGYYNHIWTFRQTSYATVNGSYTPMLTVRRTWQTYNLSPDITSIEPVQLPDDYTYMYDSGSGNTTNISGTYYYPGLVFDAANYGNVGRVYADSEMIGMRFVGNYFLGSFNIVLPFDNFPTGYIEWLTPWIDNSTLTAIDAELVMGIVKRLA